MAAKTKSSKKRGTARKRRAKKKAAAKRTTPAVGDTITKVYKGEKITVRVLEDGFRHGRKTYTSLTALAKHLTGYKAVSGPRWFGLVEPQRKDA